METEAQEAAVMLLNPITQEQQICGGIPGLPIQQLLTMLQELHPTSMTFTVLVNSLYFYPEFLKDSMSERKRV